MTILAPVILSAASFEVAPLKSGLFDFKTCGIGSLNASMARGSLEKSLCGRDVIFVGTCGSFYSFTEVHLVRGGEVFWYPPCERAGLSWSIENLHPPLALRASPLLADLPMRTVVTSPTISKEKDLPPLGDNSLSAKIAVENLELYPVVSYLLPVVRSLQVVLAVTNEICSEGRQQWRAHHKKAAEITALYLNSKLR